jgi:hypothetical protein
MTYVKKIYIFHFIYNLFNDVLHKLYSVDERILRKWWIGKYLEGNDSGRSSSRDLNPGSPKYEAEVLTTRPQRSAKNYVIQAFSKWRNAWVQNLKL